jgi:hypothetical protein
MEHVNDIKMLDMLGDHIAESDQQQFAGHIDQCDDCRQRWREFSQTWRMLEEFPADISRIDLVDRINSALTSPPESDHLTIVKPLLRIAASVLLAVAVGHLAGKLSVQKSPDYWQTSAARALHLEALLPGSSTGWAEPLLEDESPPEDTPLL